MLREYIKGKIKENEEFAIDLESDIKSRKNREKELERLIEILEDENNDGSEIFSPRSHREQNLNKLKHYQEELKSISKEIEDKQDKLSEIKKKRTEYKSMLAETEKIHQEEDKKYENIDYQTKNSQSENISVDGKTEQQAIGEGKQSEENGGYIDQQQTQDQTENEDRQSKNGEASKYTEQQEQSQTGGEKEQSEENKVGGYTGQQQTQTQIKERTDGQNWIEKGTEQEGNRNIEDRTSQEEGEQFDVRIKKQSAENQVLSEQQKEDPELKEQETAAPNPMDTKVIIQKSIEEIVKRIEAEKEQKPEQTDRNDDPGRNQERDKTGRSGLGEIEIKSAELIVLESERKKEKEFLEKIKKNLDLCFIYSGNRSKCRNELIKVKKMIESYISSIE